VASRPFEKLDELQPFPTGRIVPQREPSGDFEASSQCTWQGCFDWQHVSKLGTIMEREANRPVAQRVVCKGKHRARRTLPQAVGAEQIVYSFWSQSVRVKLTFAGLGDQLTAEIPE
jgi:hypothetical protein